MKRNIKSLLKSLGYKVEKPNAEVVKKYHGFDEDRLCIINTGILEGVNVDVYAKKQYNDYVMLTALQLMKSGVDLDMYAKEKLTSEQFKAILRAFNKGIDITTEYLDIKYSKLDYKELASYLIYKAQGVDLIEYVEKGCDRIQLNYYYKIIKNNLDLKELLDVKYNRYILKIYTTYFKKFNVKPTTFLENYNKISKSDINKLIKMLKKDKDKKAIDEVINNAINS